MSTRPVLPAGQDWCHGVNKQCAKSANCSWTKFILWSKSLWINCLVLTLRMCLLYEHINIWIWHSFKLIEATGCAWTELPNGKNNCVRGCRDKWECPHEFALLRARDTNFCVRKWPCLYCLIRVYFYLPRFFLWTMIRGFYSALNGYRKYLSIQRINITANRKYVCRLRSGRLRLVSAMIESVT